MMSGHCREALVDDGKNFDSSGWLFAHECKTKASSPRRQSRHGRLPKLDRPT